MGLPLDEHGYAFTALLTVAMQLSFFAVASTCKFDLVTDFAGSTNFIVIAVLALCLGPGGPGRARPLALTVLLTASRVELALFLLYRVFRRKRDARFDKVRDNCAAFFVFWVFQMLWVWLVALPVIFVSSVGPSGQPPVSAVDVGGWVAFVLGFGLQVAADLQKYAFRAAPENRGRFCDAGVWGVSRHPNYFGEIAMWWGLWASASEVVQPSRSPGAAWATLCSPLFTMLILLFGSGLPTAEGASLARYYEDPAEGRRWEAYRKRTSPLVPLPPALYERLPLLAKRCFFFEFKFLEYRRPESPGGEEKGAEMPEQPEGRGAAAVW